MNLLPRAANLWVVCAAIEEIDIIDLENQLVKKCIYSVGVWKPDERFPQPSAFIRLNTKPADK